MENSQSIIPTSERKSSKLKLRFQGESGMRRMSDIYHQWMGGCLGISSILSSTVEEKWDIKVIVDKDHQWWKKSQVISWEKNIKLSMGPNSHIFVRAALMKMGEFGFTEILTFWSLKILLVLSWYSKTFVFNMYTGKALNPAKIINVSYSNLTPQFSTVNF